MCARSVDEGVEALQQLKSKNLVLAQWVAAHWYLRRTGRGRWMDADLSEREAFLERLSAHFAQPNESKEFASPPNMSSDSEDVLAPPPATKKLKRS